MHTRTFYIVNTGDEGNLDPAYAARFGEIVHISSSRDDAQSIADNSSLPLVVVTAIEVRRARGRAWTEAYDPICGTLLYTLQRGAVLMESTIWTYGPSDAESERWWNAQQDSPIGAAKRGPKFRHTYKPEWSNGDVHEVKRERDFDGVATEIFREEVRRHYRRQGLTARTWGREGDPDSFLLRIEGGEIDG